MNLKEQVRFREKLDRLDIRLDVTKSELWDAIKSLVERVSALESKKTLTLKKEWQKSSQTNSSP